LRIKTGLDSSPGLRFVLYMFSTPQLTHAAIHELRAPAPSAGHLAFAVIQLAQLPGATPILWAGQAQSVYPPGLAWLGLSPARCLFAHTSTDAQTLATLEVALRGGMAGIAECGMVSRLAARRLALAAKNGGSTGFLLRHAPRFTPADSTAFATRWLITPHATDATGARRLRAELLYAKTARPGIFIINIKEEHHAPTPPALIVADARRAG